MWSHSSSTRIYLPLCSSCTTLISTGFLGAACFLLWLFIGRLVVVLLHRTLMRLVHQWSISCTHYTWLLSHSSFTWRFLFFFLHHLLSSTNHLLIRWNRLLLLHSRVSSIFGCLNRWLLLLIHRTRHWLLLLRLLLQWYLLLNWNLLLSAAYRCIHVLWDWLLSNIHLLSLHLSRRLPCWHLLLSTRYTTNYARTSWTHTSWSTTLHLQSVHRLNASIHRTACTSWLHLLLLLRRYISTCVVRRRYLTLWSTSHGHTGTRLLTLATGHRWLTGWYSTSHVGHALLLVLLSLCQLLLLIILLSQCLKLLFR